MPEIGPINSETFPHGVVCGCDCNCERTLTDGNAMLQDITHEDQPPGAVPNPYDLPIMLMLCVECYVGNHYA